MIKHYITVSIRNLSRQKGLALINILGLSIGIACFSLFLLYTVNELSFDRSHTNSSSIFRVYNWWAFSDRQGSEPASSTPMGPAMKQDLPEVKEFVRVLGAGEKFVRVGDRVQRIKISFADPQVLSVFTFPLIAGNASTALGEPNKIVLTRDKALQLFGEVNVVGKGLEIKTGENFEPYLVGGVAENIPVNSTIRFDILGSFEQVLKTDQGRESMNNWDMTIGISVFVQLQKGSNLMNEPQRLASFRQKYYPGEADLLKKDGQWNGKGVIPTGIGLQPLRDVHTNVKVDKWGAVDPKNSFILISIAFGILLIGCINFITLAIGRSAGRAREIGVRKVSGCTRIQLIYQFLTESLMLSIFSAVIGLFFAWILLPFFNELSNSSLEFSIKHYPELIWVVAGVVLFVGLFSGIYPAIALSGFEPVEVLKNNIRFSGSNLFTKSLVSFQYVLSIGLIISVFMIMKQLSYMRSINLGFDKENVVVIDTQGLDAKKIYTQLKQQLQSESNIVGIAGSEVGLGDGEGQMGGRYLFGSKDESVIEYPIDTEFIKVLGMNIIAGRNFNPGITSDTVNSVIVNEALVKNVYGLSPREVLGMQIKSYRGSDYKTIIGVIRNFNFEDLTRNVRSQLFFQPANLKPTSIFVRLQPGNPAKILAKLTTSWNSISGELPFRYNFLDQKIDDFYKKDKRWRSIIGWASGICIFLACLGLFGLTSLTVVNRSKEIGIRKVNGARIIEVMVLLNKDFVKWVFAAFVVAVPMAWYAMHQWLQNFAFRIEMSWWVFALTGLITLCIALLTVSWQSWKAATRNPVEALRYE
jgi:putative ABC transport system permease protein